jgi:hypothetical protein
MFRERNNHILFSFSFLNKKKKVHRMIGNKKFFLKKKKRGRSR